MALKESIISIKGVGEKSALLLNKLDIYNKRDLLSYFPRDYDSYSQIVPISSLKEGQMALIEAAPVKRAVLNTRAGRSIVLAEVSDGTGKIELTWFSMPYIKNRLFPGTHFVFRGKVIKKSGRLQIYQPEILTKNEYHIKSRSLQPIYPLTKGVTSNFLRKCLKAVIPELTAKDDYLPASLRKDLSLLSLNAAVCEIHFPKSRETMLEARKRLVFDEFFLFSLSVKKMKESEVVLSSEYVLKDVPETDDFISSLPYTLTKAQERTFNEIKSDLSGGNVMNRLIQGDVGSGKTVLAILSCLLTVKNGYQCAFMAPTEVLARQHFATFKNALDKYGVRIELLTGSIKASEKKKIKARIVAHEADIVLGTHALLTDDVVYDNLALVITDEQHRFGVKQRENIRKKGSSPHTLVMSATPIPRTLAVILYGDLDVSLVNELPANRLTIKNAVVDSSYRATSWKFIKKEVEAGHQAYVICPMIEKSEDNDSLSDVISYTKDLQDFLGGGIKVEMLHGKMKETEKSEIMTDFSENSIQVLVSTTVVEVGVNVPNATVMLIENAERFGLASLHQLRGRIGRGSAQGYCIFMAGSDSEDKKNRLMILEKSNDGFKIAEEDLRLRGPGDIFGVRQSGDIAFRIGDIMNDADILKLASDTAKSLDDKILNQCYDNGRKFYGKYFSYGDEALVL